MRIFRAYKVFFNINKELYFSSSFVSSCWVFFARAPPPRKTSVTEHSGDTSGDPSASARVFEVFLIVLDGVSQVCPIRSLLPLTWLISG